MDEKTLNDLLECSVCLERLDTSSKVLPCQHTFCRKCLEVIVQSHRELRCPECRVLVDSKIDELPPNVLLMRILEGMKNSTVSHQMLMKKSQKNSQNFLEGNLINLHHHHHQPHRVGVGGTIAVDTPTSITGLQQAKFVAGSNPQSVKLANSAAPSSTHKEQGKRPNNPFPLASIPHARALYDFASKEVGDLNFKTGEVIIMRKLLDQNWCIGEVNGREGAFPLNHVDVINPLPIPQCKALYNFRMGPNEEEGCLIFNKGAIIQVLRRVDQNWAEGKIGDVIGIFPIAFVEMNMTARHLMDTASKSVAHNITSRVVPPKPFDNIMTSDSSSTSTTTSPNSGSTSNTSSNSSTAPNSPTSNLTNGVQAGGNHPTENNKEKRHSLIPIISSSTQSETATAVITPQSNLKTNHERTPLTQQQRAKLVQQRFNRFPALCEAIYSYKPQNPDELELKKGSTYYVIERCQDGWLKGSNRAKKSGVFPGNYVIPLIKNRSGGNDIDGARSHTNHGADVQATGENSLNADHPPHPPELPPRNITPPPSSSSTSQGGWTKHLTNVDHLFAKKSSKDNHHNAVATQSAIKSEKKESSSSAVSLMKRLTHIKRSKSPNSPSTFSMDNPVFEDIIAHNNATPQSMTGGGGAAAVSATPSTSKHSIKIIQPVHVRSGSCPSQLLQNISLDLGMNTSSGETSMPFIFGGSKRIKTHGKERPSLQDMRLNVEIITSSGSKQKYSVPDGNGSQSGSKQPGPSGVQQQQQQQQQPVMTTSSGGKNPSAYHRKSQSLDATLSPIASSNHHDANAAASSSKNKSTTQMRERFRCIVPYPPNSEYELELSIGDIVCVHKKRDNGWYKGVHQRTGKTGLFPASFVEPDI